MLYEVITIKLDFLVYWVATYAGFAFMVNLIREIIKDMEDFEGDAVFGRRTVPIAWGMKTTRWLVIGLIVLVILPLFYLILVHLDDKWSYSYILLFIIVPLLLTAVITSYSIHYTKLYEV